MNKIFDIIYQITAIPLHISVKKFFFKSISKKKIAKQFEEDSKISTYFQSEQFLQLSPIPFVISASILALHKETILRNAEAICEHRFCYLGVNANHNLTDKFVPNEKNNNYAQKLLRSLPNEYQHLDWQQDFQSSYRFSHKQWYKHIRYEYIHGVDAKNPIEFGRMQHLPHLIYASVLTCNDNNNSDKYLDEFQHQVIDFILQNPPRYGIQWLVSMDVGIRLFTIVVAYSLAKSNNLHFSKEFEQILANSIVDHCNHIYNNLEWSSGMRGNHYLANLTGLLAGAMILPDSILQKNKWINFSSEQLLNELLFQFQEDGSNFEDSTCYHRLSAEIELFGLASVLYVSKSNKYLSNSLTQKLHTLSNPNSSYYQRLQNIFNFSEAILYDDLNHTLIQIGDDDSGQMCKLEPHLDFHSVDNALLSTQLKAVIDGFNGLRTSLVANWISQLVNPLNIQQLQNQSIVQSFPNFGLYRYNLTNATLFFHCNSTLGQLGKGGHTHNDVLSMLLSVHKQRILVDPGTFTYTPYPEIRNKFRSTEYHNTLSVERMEQNILFEGSGHNLFWLRHKAKAKTLYYDEKLIVMEHSGFGIPHRREVQIFDNQIVGKDYCSINKKKYLYFHFAPECTVEKVDNGYKVNSFVQILLNDSTSFEIETYDYSPQYGIKVPAKRLKVRMDGKEIQWRIEW
ncbi:MAG: alginate lyase family protein [Candidatus Kapabacteria bacterium]|nr:alginate lyase family protein [Candidatus Kapabacteria bacterium]